MIKGGNIKFPRIVLVVQKMMMQKQTPTSEKYTDRNRDVVVPILYV